MNRTTSTLIICFFALLSINCNAQEQFTTYDNTYCGKKYVIFVSVKGNGIFTLWINAMSFDDQSKGCGIIVQEKDYYTFIDAIKLAKLKYEDRVEEAKKNNVRQLDKTMRIFNTVDAYFKQEKLYLQRNVLLNYDFKVREIDGKLNYLLFISTGILKASNNTLAESNGSSLVFSSVEEIDKFINQLSTEKIDEFILRTDSIGYIKKLRKSDGSWHPKTQCGFFSKVTLGIKAGYNTSPGMNNLSSGHSSENSLSTASLKMSGGLNTGVFGRVNFNKFYLQPEVLYSKWQKGYILSFPDNQLQEVEFNKTVYVSTLDIPLLLGYNVFVLKKSNLHLFAGPKLRLNAGSSVEQTYFHTYGTTNSTDLKTDITPARLGLETGFGFDFSALTVDVRYNFIQDMYHTELYSHTIDNFSANTFVVSIGWKLFMPVK